jgi:ribosomal protein L14
MSTFGSNYVARQLLNTFAKRIGNNVRWLGKDKKQQLFVDNEYTNLQMDEIDAESQIGGTDIVKAFLSRKQIDLDLPDSIDAGDICAAVVLDIKSKWKNKGTEIKIAKPANLATQDDKYYHGANLSTSVSKDSNGFWFATIPMTNGDYVIFEQKTHVNSSPEELEANGLHFLPLAFDYQLSQRNYVGMIFPQVDMDTKRDIHELIGAVSDTDKQFTIAICKGRCQLQLNHIGAKLKMAMGGVAVTTSIRQEYIWSINDTFAVHFCRKDSADVEQVYASVLITPDAFKQVTIEFDEAELSDDDDEIDEFDDF